MKSVLSQASIELIFCPLLRDFRKSFEPLSMVRRHFHKKVRPWFIVQIQHKMTVNWNSVWYFRFLANFFCFVFSQNDSHSCLKFIYLYCYYTMDKNPVSSHVALVRWILRLKSLILFWTCFEWYGKRRIPNSSNNSRNLSYGPKPILWKRIFLWNRTFCGIK